MRRCRRATAAIVYHVLLAPVDGKCSAQFPYRFHNPVHIDVSTRTAPCSISEISLAAGDDIEVGHGNVLPKTLGTKFVQQSISGRPIWLLCTCALIFHARPWMLWALL